MFTGTWNPGGFPPWVTLCSKMALFGSMMIRGVDYYVGDAADTARRLSTVEAAAPLWVWGLVLIVGSLVGFGSICVRFGQGVLVGHVVGMLGYVLLSVGIISDVVARSEVGWSDMLVPGIVLIVGALASVVVFRVSRWQHAEITTVGLTLSAAVAAAAVPLDGLRNASILLTIGIIHGLLAIGTASRLRQEKIERGGVAV